MSVDEVPVLWHIKMSNYNEKARWALDYKGVAHRRRDPMPGTHMLFAPTRRVATFPVLELDGRRLGDSTRIIAALEQRFPDPPLHPADPEQRSRPRARGVLRREPGPRRPPGRLQRALAEPGAAAFARGGDHHPRQGRVLSAALPAFAAS